jgi:hypothetical protein
VIELYATGRADVVNVATPLALRGLPVVFSGEVPFIKMTEPVGIDVAAELTVAVRVTLVPAVTDAAEVVNTVVVGSRVTVPDNEMTFAPLVALEELLATLTVPVRVPEVAGEKTMAILQDAPDASDVVEEQSVPPLDTCENGPVNVISVRSKEAEPTLEIVTVWDALVAPTPCAAKIIAPAPMFISRMTWFELSAT